MKRCIALTILCAFLVSCPIFVSTVFSEMKKVDDKELARTNAPATKAVNSKKIPVTVNFDNTVMLSPQQINKNGEGFNLNPAANPETWSYNFSTYNQNYWGGNVSGVMFRPR